MLYLTTKGVHECTWIKKLKNKGKYLSNKIDLKYIAHCKNHLNLLVLEEFYAPKQIGLAKKSVKYHIGVVELNTHWINLSSFYF